MKNLVFLHGWGQDKSSFEPLMEAFQHKYDCHLIDLPGFGAEEAPKEAWVPSQYADFVADYCDKNKIKEAVFLGHSFGGKISALLAARHPKKVKALVLIAASGLKPPRKLSFRIKAFSLRMLGKLAGLIDGLFSTNYKDQYRKKFGSHDYRNSDGVMRDILIKTVNEDISNIAEQIRQKALILYAENDTQTPPSVGRKYHYLIKGSEFVCYRNQDHYSLLNDGRFQLQRRINQFLEELK